MVKSFITSVIRPNEVLILLLAISFDLLNYHHYYIYHNKWFRVCSLQSVSLYTLMSY